jgi:hypothetical protein
LGSSLQVRSINGTKESIILAVDKRNNVRLAALQTSDEALVLSSETTALAMVRMLSGPIPPSTTPAAYNDVVRNTPSYRALVSAVESAMTTGTALASASAVHLGVGRVLADIPDSSGQSQRASRPKALAIDRERYEGPVPAIILKGSEHVPLGGDVFLPSAQTISNDMRIPWLVETVDPNGKNLSLIRLASNSSAKITTGGGAYSVKVFQDEETRREMVVELGLDIASLALPYVTGSGCTISILRDAFLTAVKAAVLPPDPSSLDKFIIALIPTISFANEVLSRCSSTEYIILIAGQAAPYISAISKAYKTVRAAQLFLYVESYWSEPPETRGICVSSAGYIISCSTRIKFSAGSYVALAGTSLEPFKDLGMKVFGGDPEYETPIPANLKWLLPAPPAGVTLTDDGELSSMSQSSLLLPAVVVKDPATEVTGTYVASFAKPVIKPNQASDLRLSVGETKILSLVAADGNSEGATVVKPPISFTKWVSTDAEIADTFSLLLVGGDCPREAFQCVTLKAFKTGTTALSVTARSDGAVLAGPITVTVEDGCPAEATNVCSRQPAATTAQFWQKRTCLVRGKSYTNSDLFCHLAASNGTLWLGGGIFLFPSASADGATLVPTNYNRSDTLFGDFPFAYLNLMGSYSTCFHGATYGNGATTASVVISEEYKPTNLDVLANITQHTPFCRPGAGPVGGGSITSGYYNGLQLFRFDVRGYQVQ